MKKFLIILIILFIGRVSHAENYRQIYKNLEVPTFAYLHGVDPMHFFENKDSSYSVYPLLRLSSALYFKSITITPGYYDLTPREYQGKDYILFKQNGKVVHILPVYKKDITPIDFYKKHLPKEKKPITAKIGDGFHKFIGKCFKRAKRKPLAKTYLEVNDVADNFVILVVYYDEFRYYLLVRTVKM